jgi:hypothetical protein
MCHTRGRPSPTSLRGKETSRRGRGYTSDNIYGGNAGSNTAMRKDAVVEAKNRAYVEPSSFHGAMFNLCTACWAVGTEAGTQPLLDLAPVFLHDRCE